MDENARKRVATPLTPSNRPNIAVNFVTTRRAATSHKDYTSFARF